MILPDEIVNKEFSRAKRGYDIDEVEDYIGMLLEKYDALCQENAELEKNLKSVLSVLENKKKTEASATELLSAAKKESERIIAEAQSKADRIASVNVAGNFAKEDGELSELTEKIAKSRREYARLREEIDSYKLRLYDMYSKHISLIEQIPLPDADSESPEHEDYETSYQSQSGADSKILSQIKEAEDLVAEKRSMPRFNVNIAVPVEEVVKPLSDNAAKASDTESSLKFGLNIIREPVKVQQAENYSGSTGTVPVELNANISREDTGDYIIVENNAPLKFLSKDRFVKKKK